MGKEIRGGGALPAICTTPGDSTVTVEFLIPRVILPLAEPVGAVTTNCVGDWLTNVVTALAFWNVTELTRSRLVPVIVRFDKGATGSGAVVPTAGSSRFRSIVDVV